MLTWTNRREACLFGVSSLFANVIVMGLCISGGCCDEEPFDKWHYIETPGTATILAVRDADPELYNCDNDPVEVLYEFAPDDPNAEPHPEIPWGYTVEDGWHLTIGGGASPPREWVESESLTVGSQHRCIRRHLTHPTAMPSPVTFFFPDLDYDAAIDACWD